MGFFSKLGRQVETFKRTAEDAAEETTTVTCPACEERVDAQQEQCPACGSDLDASTAE